ncbi:hypothetical protein F050043D4_13570 [Bacteroides thetaiotaomicron]
MHDQTGSGFIYLSMIIAPVAYYRFGSWAICWLEDDKKKLQFLFISILLYLIPVLLLTIQDILIVGFVNESRYLLSDIGKEESTLSATIYGLMSSAGIAFVSIIFAESLKLKEKAVFFSLAAIALVIVVHLINRTGIVLLIVSIILSFGYSTGMRLSKVVSSLLLLLLVLVIIIKSGLVSQEIIDAYIERESGTTDNATELGGRSGKWQAAISDLMSSPFGWKRVGYVHNLWLDLAAVAGWITTIPFVVATINVLRTTFRMIKRHVTPFRLVVVTMVVAMFLNCMVEPVIEASLLFFVLMMFVWGMLKAESEEMVLNH